MKDRLEEGRIDEEKDGWKENKEEDGWKDRRRMDEEEDGWKENEEEDGWKENEKVCLIKNKLICADLY